MSPRSTILTLALTTAATVAALSDATTEDAVTPATDTTLAACELGEAAAATVPDAWRDGANPRYGLRVKPKWRDETSTGASYRPATAAEREANDWPEGTFLMTDSMLLDTAAAGRPELAFTLPITPARATVVDMFVYDVNQDETYISTEVGIEGRFIESAVRPTFYTYRQVGFSGSNPGRVDDMLLRVISDDLGGFFASGVVGSERFEMSGPYDPASLELEVGSDEPIIVGFWTDPQVPANPCGNWIQAPGQEANQGECYHQQKPGDDCWDGLDNDDDGLKDGLDPACQHSDTFNCDGGPPHAHRYEAGKTFALLGTGIWCKQHEDNWWTKLHAMGHDTVNLMNQVPRQGPLGVNHEAHYGGAHCYVFPDHSQLDIAKCESRYNEPNPDSWMDHCPTLDYPFAGATSNASALIGRAWVNVEETMHINGAWPLPLNMAAVVTNASGFPDHPGAIGVAPVTDPANMPASDRLGAAVIGYNDQAPYTLAHELSHTMGLYHDTMENGYMNAVGKYLMNLGIIDNDAPAHVRGTDNLPRWTTAMLSDESYPRPSGYNYAP